MARLRAQGLVPAEIGRRLGVTRQRVGQLLRAIDRAQSRSLTCRVCGGSASPAGATPPDAVNVLCLPCLARRPEAPFGERLRSCRAAAGLRRDELARRTGLSTGTLKRYEGGTHGPRWQHLMMLLRELGLSLVAPGHRAGESDKPGWESSPTPQSCPA